MRWNLRMEVEAIMARVSGEHGGRVADDRDDLSGVGHTGASKLTRVIRSLCFHFEREVISNLIRLLPLSRGPRALIRFVHTRQQPIDKVDDPDDDNGDGQRTDKDGAARSDALARRRAPSQAAQL